MANLITYIRILCSLSLLFCPIFSVPFFILYLIAGGTDMADGAVARKTHTESAFGARLDTFADFVMFVVCAVKLFPMLSLPMWLYGWVGAIALKKCINVGIGYARQKEFVSVHCLPNKWVGGLLFVFPLTAWAVDATIYATVLCVMASFAAFREGAIIVSTEERRL